MWNVKRDMINPYKLEVDVFGLQSSRVRHQCVRFHRFWLFIAVFLSIDLLYRFVFMSVINCIDCRIEEKTEAYILPSFMFSGSSLNGNLLVFKDLNVIQMGIKKIDERWSNLLTIWGRDQKTEVQMLEI